ncbi:RagB/SusD family nutrient uptake outer membrane protein [soil metagenome]
MKSINKILLLILFAAGMAGCKKSFLDRPSESQISSNNFYKTKEDVRLATASLYGGAPWGAWNYSTYLQLGDILSGNLYYSWFGDYIQLSTRTITAQNSVLQTGWSGLYNVIAQCNTTLSGIDQYASASIAPADKNAAIGEAKFIRATAYYKLAINWGAVPIIEDNTTLINDPLLKRNILIDVYKFIAKDLTYAAENLPAADVAGRVTTWSAQGMLGKVYLTMAGLGQSAGTRNQAFLDSAIKYAGNVCKKSGLSLLSNYANLFKPQFNDNPEALFSLQWAPGVGWNLGNQLQHYSPSNDIMPQKTGAWTPLAPTWGLYQLYSGKDTIRRKATFMLPGDFYPELNSAAGGYTANGATMKKHIVGNEKDNTSPTMDQNSSVEHNALLRLADVYLVYAEAILGNNGTTSDNNALTYFNAVRSRAGVDPVTAISMDDMLKERRIEFALEGQYWSDLVRLSYYNPQKAVDMLNSQQNITFSYAAGVGTPTPAGSAGGPIAIVPATISNFTLQLPASDVASDPSLAEPPVPYY